MTGKSGVDSVIDDRSILANFYKLLGGARNAVVIVAVILLIAATLLVANTIRLSAFSRRRETGIMRLVGASNFYIQLPFLLEGHRRPDRLGDLRRPPDCREVPLAGYATAVLHFQRGSQHG